MAGSLRMTGNTAGPTPWWQLPGYDRNVPNLEQSAPNGYYYDKVKQGYIETPEAKGSKSARSIKSFMDGIGSIGGLGDDGGGGGGGVTDFGGGINSGAPIPTIQMPDPTKATNAAFAQAKDQAGAMSRAALTSMSDELGASGMIGSGAQVQGTRDIMENNVGTLGQVSRDLAGKTADQALDVSKTNYQGGITQRGQDIAAQEARARLAMQRQQMMWDRLKFILGGLGGGGNAEEGEMVY